MNLLTRASILALLPLALLLMLAIPEAILRRQVSENTARLHRATLAAAAARDIADNQQFASLALRRRVFHDRTAATAYAMAISAIRASMSQLPALAGHDPATIEAVNHILASAAIELTVLGSIDTQLRQGHFAAAAASLARPAYTTNAEQLSVAARAFVLLSRASEAEHFALLARLGNTSLLLFVIAGVGLTLSSVLLLYYSGSATRAILDIGRKSERYWRAEPLGEPSSRRDEIGLLDAALYEFVARIEEQARALEGRAQASEEKFRDSEGIRETFSTAFIPRPLPEIADLAFDAVYLPADEEARVGGDWYDVIQLDGDHVLVSIGDVMGHGPAAALSTVKLRQAIIGSALDERDPAAILHRAGRAFALVDESIATALVVVFDRRSRRFRYAIAGHPAPIVASAEHVALLLGTHGIPIGIDPKRRYESFEHALLDGELLVLYTDGLIEARHTIIEDELRILAAAREAAAGRCDARGIARMVLGTMSIPDDVAILTLRISSDTTHRRQDVLKYDSEAEMGLISGTAGAQTH